MLPSCGHRLCRGGVFFCPRLHVFKSRARPPKDRPVAPRHSLLKAPLPASIPKREVNQLPVFQRGRFPSASAPHPSARFKGFSARPFSFLSPERAPDIHLPLSSYTPSWPLTAFFFISLALYHHCSAQYRHLQDQPVDCSTSWRTTTPTPKVITWENRTPA